jgi:hypothetical protein
MTSTEPFPKRLRCAEQQDDDVRNLPRLILPRPESWARRREESPAHKTSRKKEKRRRKRGGQA